MAWLQRLFGVNKADIGKRTQTPRTGGGGGGMGATAERIAPEHMGLNGEFDQNGLAKRVALALDDDGKIQDIKTLTIAQMGDKVVLKGRVIDRDTLMKIVTIARAVRGVKDVMTDQVTFER